MAHIQMYKLVASSPATELIGEMGREIEIRQGTYMYIGRQFKKITKEILPWSKWLLFERKK
jgi:Uri superfamily endonuclease